MVNGIKNFNGENLIRGDFQERRNQFKLLNKNFNAFSETPTGVMISSHDLLMKSKFHIIYLMMIWHLFLHLYY